MNVQGCAAYQLDTDDDGVSDDIDECPGTPAEDWNIVNRDTGCTPAQLEQDEFLNAWKEACDELNEVRANRNSKPTTQSSPKPSETVS